MKKKRQRKKIYQDKKKAASRKCTASNLQQTYTDHSKTSGCRNRPYVLRSLILSVTEKRALTKNWIFYLFFDNFFL